jgi:glycosyltransferase involved in cell wall biosynthesis
VLLVTLCANGGVAALAAAAQRWLGERGIRPDLAWYEPWRQTPALSVPLFALPFRAPGVLRARLPDGATLHRVGVRLPELEALRHRPSRRWREVLAGYDVVLAVCGSVLPAGVTRGFAGGVLAWVATPYDGDRALRRRQFSWPRRLLDAWLDAPLCRLSERRLLRDLPVMTISRYGDAALRAAQPAARLVACVPWPLDLEEIPVRPWPAATGRGRRIGFFGRHGDPRKNLPLLLAAFAGLRRRRGDVCLVLAGAAPDPTLRDSLAAQGLADAVELHGEVPRERLLELYGSLDLFVIPSQQEGLGIVGLEAMATGRPVLSTRCGGPQDYVIEGETGWFVAAEAGAMAARLDELLGQPELLRAAGLRARALVARDYARDRVGQRFQAAFDAVAPRPATRA